MDPGCVKILEGIIYIFDQQIIYPFLYLISIALMGKYTITKDDVDSEMIIYVLINFLKYLSISRNLELKIKKQKEEELVFYIDEVKFVSAKEFKKIQNIIQILMVLKLLFTYIGYNSIKYNITSFVLNSICFSMYIDIFGSYINKAYFKIVSITFVTYALYTFLDIYYDWNSNINDSLSIHLTLALTI
jgi:hypothetical protein